MAEVIVAFLLSVIAALLGFFLKRMDTILEKHNENIIHSHDRHDVTDRIVSTLIKKPYDSSHIVRQGSPFPEIHD